MGASSQKPPPPRASALNFLKGALGTGARTVIAHQTMQLLQSLTSDEEVLDVLGEVIAAGARENHLDASGTDVQKRARQHRAAKLVLFELARLLGERAKSALQTRAPRATR